MTKSDDFAAGHYVATATVHSTRRNLFTLEPGRERHIATLVSGSRTKIAEFENDCERIVTALAAYDAAETERTRQPRETPVITNNANPG